MSAEVPALYNSGAKHHVVDLDVPPSPSPRMRLLHRCNALLLVIAALAVNPAHASAQFGGLMKKARDKVAQATDDGNATAPGQALDEPTLVKLLAGFRAADQSLAARDKLNAERTERSNALSAMRERNQPARDAYNSADETVSSCRSSSLAAIQEARNTRIEKQMESMAGDPVFMGKAQIAMMKFAQATQAAQKSNDPAALQKAQLDMQRELIGTDLFAEVKKDSATVDAKCGKPVDRPAALAAEDALQKQIDAIDVRIRELEAKAVNDGARVAGMDRVKYAELKERVKSVYERARQDQNRGAYGSEEMALVQKHRSEIEQFKRVL